MKYLIVGLGNPGEKYENTRHNIGFKVLEAFAKEREASFEIGRHGHIAMAKFKGRTFILVKPTTFMNLSGKAVSYWLQTEKYQWRTSSSSPTILHFLLESFE